ncbi:MAG TPA: MG2 domain-containing protein [Abditibacteriaceae bacterium]|jgi:hypothetical protein
MKTVLRVLALVGLVTMLLCMTPANAQGTKKMSVLQQADAAWNEKSYARALEMYRKALQGGRLADRDEVEFRIAVSLGKTEQWDAAIAAGEALLAKTQWKARVLYWMGRLYTVVPHQGYKVGGKIYRGQDYPKIEGAEKPQQVWIAGDDAEATLSYFERAKITAQQESELVKTALFKTPIHRLGYGEEIDLNFDLAAFLPAREYDEFIKALEAKQTLDETVNTNQPYDTKWNLPKKVLYLYNEIRKLDVSADKHDTALSLLAKGLFVRSYRQRMDQWANKYDDVKKTYVKQPYPFDHLEAIPVWQQLIDEFPRDPVADRTQILIAQTWEQQSDLVKALAAYNRVLELFPRSKWVSDARANIQQITKREIALDTMAAQPPGQTAKINITTRNIKQVTLTAYRVKLEDVLTQTAKLNDPETRFTEFSENFGSLEDARKFFGPRAATWTFMPKDKGDYTQAHETIDTPLKELGAYVVVANASTVRFARVLVLSDLAILKKVDRDGAFSYVADARTGQPIQNASVLLKETYHDSGGVRKASIARGQSSEIGFFDKKLTRGPNIYSNTVESFAWAGNRYAMTGQGNSGWWGYGDNRDEMKIYAYTDRPVYRPGQKIYFRQILTARTKGDQQPAKGVKVTVRINNPKGEEIFKRVLTSSEFGTINGEFNLPEETPLGEYFINAEVPQTTQNVAASGGNRFRVEEYKRPEFQVTVDAPNEAVRPGETVAAKINAKYYFGSPVPNASVKYTVRRSTWWANYRFPTPYDWLYTYWGEGDYNTGRRNIGGEGSGTIVKEGTVRTDAQGNAEVTFTATKDEVNENEYGWWWRRYSNPLYTIEVEATDASRRTIEGQGAVKVANQQYFAFLQPKRGYFQIGDRVEIEVVTQDANDKPVGASGTMTVYKLLPGDKEEKIYDAPVRTDAKGRAFWTWPSDEAGHYRIAYEATDAWGQKVIGSTEIWVNGPDFGKTQFRLQGVTIVLEQRNYEEGDTIKALLVAAQPNTTVLFTQEAGGEILRRDVINIEGKSKEVSIPVRHEHVPNFALAAAVVKNFEVFQAQAEVFVPPTQQLINVSVASDKNEYKPGEKGTFTLKATDSAGNPARAELSVALADASLFYIQKDYAPDIRTFYYGERRAISVNLDSSRSGQPEGRIEDDTSYQNYETHNWELPDDMGQLNLDPGSGGGYYGYRSRGRLLGGGGGGAALPLGVESMTSVDPQNALLARGGAAFDMAAPAQAKRKDGIAGEESQLAAANVRSNFAETAFWSPAVVTQNGTAKVEVTFPDSLTQWQATVRGLTTTAQVGAGQEDVETKKNLLVRLQAPRFFVDRDQVVLTANVHNYLKTDKRVKVALQMGDGLKLNLTRIAPLSQGTNLSALDGYVVVKAGEEARINWTVDAVRDGDTSVQMTAQTDEESDAVKMEFPVLVHGVQRFASQSGVLREGNRQTVNINIPKARRFGASTLNVQLNPSLAATMLDALPYLADYPYGCVEQTMSRFLPSVVVARTLSESGVNLNTLRTRAKAYEVEAKTQPLGERVKNTGYTYPTGMPNARNLEEMASKLWHHGRSNNPIYDAATLQKMIDEGLQRLYAMQREDGGWGWWPGSAQSDEYMSAYVVYGLATARAAEVNVRADVLNRGFQYLQRQMKDEDNLHLLTYMAYALSQRGNLPDDVKQVVAGRLFTQRERLTAYSKSLLAMALWNSGEKDKARVLVRNLENTAKIDEAKPDGSGGTARWNLGNQWWHWWNNDVETNAVALRAFLQIEPTNRLVPMMMKWLTTQARGNHWRSTKETAEAVYSLADYVRVNKELDVDYTLTVNLNGKVARTYQVNSDNALYFDNRFIVGDLFLQDGANAITITKEGKGNLYWSAASEYFSLEEPIKASGNEIAVKRRYFKLTRNPEVKAEQGSEELAASDTAVSSSANAPASTTSARGKRGIGLPRPVPQPATPEYTRTALKDGDVLQSSDLVEVELVLDAANDYEYLVFEDMKAAGLEPVEVRSGYGWGDGLSSNVELRDEKVAFFVDRLPQGTRVLRYRMRAEIPGRFHALPTNGYAMYAPEVRAISDEERLSVRD